MCGITGCLAVEPTTRNEAELTDLVSRMTDTLIHRGPDDRGIWVDPSAGIGLGHRRLSVLDLSPLGRQPMQSKSGRYTIVYNGEVYNFRELRRELKQLGHSFQSDSDTEVILAAFEQWPLAEAVKRFVGMFAFAVWDSRKRQLHLVRDRLGIKPLYYGWVKNDFVFGSELKALRHHPRWEGEIDRESLSQFIQYSYVPTPNSIFKGIKKLPPATVLTLKVIVEATKLNSASNKPTVSTEGPVTYWSAAEAFEAGQLDLFEGTEQEAIAQLDDNLREAVSARMISDVPLGAFLSGGIDSSLIVALMQSQSSRPIKTFTIGFQDSFYNEAEHAREIATHLGTDHNQWYVTSRDAMDVIPQLPGIYDEPFADSSQIPTYLVSKLARQQVTVALSGDGGDELFAGYNRYFQAPRIWKSSRLLPRFARRSLGRALLAVPANFYDPILARLSPVLPKVVTSRVPSNTVQKIAQIMQAESFSQVYQQIASTWSFNDSPVLGSVRIQETFEGEKKGVSDAQVRQMMLSDLVRYHPDDILTKVDRASMGVGLEARVPMIDHRVVEFSARLPLRMLIKGGSGKWILRRLLAQYIPPPLFERPKKGFGVPLGAWLRGPLKDWSNQLLSQSRLENDGYFSSKCILDKWQAHQSGRHDFSKQLWNVIVFNAWLSSSSIAPARSERHRVVA